MSAQSCGVGQLRRMSEGDAPHLFVTLPCCLSVVSIRHLIGRNWDGALKQRRVGQCVFDSPVIARTCVYCLCTHVRDAWAESDE